MAGFSYDAGTGTDLTGGFGTGVTLPIAADSSVFLSAPFSYQLWCEIGSAGDVDMVKADLTAGTTYLLGLSSNMVTNTVADIDPRLSIYDSAGTQLYSVTGTEFGSGGTSSGLADVLFTPSTSGTYYIEAQSEGWWSGDQATGSYALFGYVTESSSPTTTNTVSGSSAADTLTGTSANDRIEAGAGNDYLYGTAGDDVVLGQSGADSLEGGAGADVIYGNRQDDMIWGETGDDVLYGGQDVDQVAGGIGADAVYGNFGNDSLWGESGDDSLFGGQNDDTIWGGDGNDHLYGNLHNDYLIGNDGADYIDGGGGDNDAAAFSGNRSAHTVTRIDADTLLVDGQDTVVGCEYLVFDDGYYGVGLF